MAQDELDELKRAAVFLHEGRPERARRILVDWLRGNPKSADGWYLLSLAVQDAEQQRVVVKK